MNPLKLARLTATFVILIPCLMLTSAHAGNDRMATDAPPETAQLAALIGHWSIEDFRLDADGNWQSGTGADWHFYWILNGTAIQDDWVSPGLATPAPESGRQYGTNIRIYNPTLKQWEMAWASSKGQQIDTFTATQTEDGILMEGVFSGNPSRILFHDIREDRFSWNLHVQVAEGQWREVYRIEGTRRGSQPSGDAP